MYIRNATRFGKKMTIIHPGEFYVSDADEVIGTLLGSCVAVCLIDHRKSIAGMNHFMLPGRITANDIFKDDSAKYGITAIHRLIEAMVERGASKKDIEAKIFGGGHVLDLPGKNTIPFDNIRLARMMLEFEDIHIQMSDVGENYTRKVLLDVQSGRAFLKRSTRQDVYQEIIRKEAEYARRNLFNG
jgi:chemotaxis protein CheD